MAARVTEVEVRSIMESSPTDLAPFITLATLLVDEELGDSTLSPARLKEIERWLAAHFAAVKAPLTTQESIKVGVSYQRSQSGKMLMATQYGQQAVALDTTGVLKAMTNPDSVGLGIMISNVTEAWQE